MSANVYYLRGKYRKYCGQRFSFWLLPQSFYRDHLVKDCGFHPTTPIKGSAIYVTMYKKEGRIDMIVRGLCFTQGDLTARISWCNHVSRREDVVLRPGTDFVADGIASSDRFLPGGVLFQKRLPEPSAYEEAWRDDPSCQTSCMTVAEHSDG